MAIAKGTRVPARFVPSCPRKPGGFVAVRRPPDLPAPDVAKAVDPAWADSQAPDWRPHTRLVARPRVR